MLLSALTHKVRGSREGLIDARIVGSLYGLRNMSTSVKETQDFLDAVHSKLGKASAIVCGDQRTDLQNAHNMLYGLQNCSLYGEDWKVIIAGYFLAITEFLSENNRKLTLQHDTVRDQIY